MMSHRVYAQRNIAHGVSVTLYHELLHGASATLKLKVVSHFNFLVSCLLLIDLPVFCVFNCQYLLENCLWKSLELLTLWDFLAGCVVWIMVVGSCLVLLALTFSIVISYIELFIWILNFVFVFQGWALFIARFNYCRSLTVCVIFDFRKSEKNS